MRRGMIAVALVAFSAQQPQRVEAGAFASEITQVLNHGQLVMQYIRQGQQLANEINMYENMLRNARALPGQTFGPIAADINALAAIVQGGQALAYSLGNLDQLFRQTFPGYGYNANAYYMNYKGWSQASLDTTLGALRAAGMQGQQLQSEQSVLSALRSMAQTSDGRMQALQVLGEISEQQVQQLMKLRELMMADMSSKQAYQAAVIQQETSAAAATERFFTYTPSNTDRRAYHAGWN